MVRQLEALRWDNGFLETARITMEASAERLRGETLVRGGSECCDGYVTQRDRKKHGWTDGRQACTERSLGTRSAVLRQKWKETVT